MYELKKNGKVFTSKSVETGPSSYKKRICRAAVSQRLRNTVLQAGWAKFLLNIGWSQIKVMESGRVLRGKYLHLAI